MKAIVEGLRSDTKAQKNLEQSLDERTGGVMKRLRAAFPKWKDEDFLLYLFTASGFSATTIKASSSPDSEDFLACLEK